ncbi:MAG: STM4012 family radical SAM protein [Gallionellaceae bacterium]
MNYDFRTYLSTQSRFQSYLYSYPHKTAYRQFGEPVDLAQLWQTEKKDALYLYSHIPFCRMKCAFCNLFTLSHPPPDQVARYIAKLAQEARAVRDILGEFCFAGYAVGGGTPSLLDARQLAQLFAIYSEVLSVDLARTPGSFEISPDTITNDKLAVLAEHGVGRISIGIQSFIENEARAMGRQQPREVTGLLLEKIASYGFPVFNIDLIYGIPEQTPSSWLSSLKQALIYRPTELFLYPLYVRPLTPMFKKTSAQPTRADPRDELYLIARDFLLEQGYEQDSMRLFRLPCVSQARGIDYSCQEDGMIGLGTNARSYTRAIHYSTEYAVNKPNVAAIVADYLQKPAEAFYRADFGVKLSDDDRKRRYLIKSLLKAEGVDKLQYRRLFATDLIADFPELGELQSMQLAEEHGDTLRLSGEGMAYSDLLGHWFISVAVKNKMREYVLK